jgi:heme-degrading monooxygenase HmoA
MYLHHEPHPRISDALSREPRPGGTASAFEAMWKTRDSHLKSVPGFVSFHLMRGEVEGDARFMPPTRSGPDKDAFLAWTKSEAFRAAHKGAKPSEAMYDGPPVLECFDSVQAIEAD